jgi:hypothetical protein
MELIIHFIRHKENFKLHSLGERIKEIAANLFSFIVTYCTLLSRALDRRVLHNAILVLATQRRCLITLYRYSEPGRWQRWNGFLVISFDGPLNTINVVKEFNDQVKGFIRRNNPSAIIYRNA